MIKYKFKIGKETIEASLPTSWDEITVKQFQNLNFKTWDGIDIVQAIARLSGVDASALYETESKPLEAVYAALSFLSEDPPEWEELKHQKEITLWGKLVRVPEDLENESFGLWVEFQQLAEENDVAKIAALYLQPVLHGKIDLNLRKKVYEDLLNHKLLEVAPIVSFFFVKLKEYRIYGRPVLGPFPVPVSRE
ncbi:hypothetical protein LCGC14_1479790 [marine sediment metagenome]|uniref:Uncharacterized protein n=1 Tax=marine sediment metagenome TaxID=412755 RepID=A0A0F9J9U9_9ZZZZ